VILSILFNPQTSLEDPLVRVSSLATEKRQSRSPIRAELNNMSINSTSSHNHIMILATAAYAKRTPNMGFPIAKQQQEMVSNKMKKAAPTLLTSQISSIFILTPPIWQLPGLRRPKPLVEALKTDRWLALLRKLAVLAPLPDHLLFTCHTKNPPKEPKAPPRNNRRTLSRDQTRVSLRRGVSHPTGCSWHKDRTAICPLANMLSASDRWDHSSPPLASCVKSDDHKQKHSSQAADRESEYESPQHTIDKIIHLLPPPRLNNIAPPNSKLDRSSLLSNPPIGVTVPYPNHPL